MDHCAWAGVIVVGGAILDTSLCNAGDEQLDLRNCLVIGFVVVSGSSSDVTQEELLSTGKLRCFVLVPDHLSLIVSLTTSFMQ